MLIYELKIIVTKIVFIMNKKFIIDL